MNLFTEHEAAVDLDALAELAAASPTRRQIQGRYTACAKSGDLMAHGYTVVVWYNVAERATLYEYKPLDAGDPRYAGPRLPRVALSSYADQVRLHQALGIRVTAAGQTFNR